MILNNNSGGSSVRNVIERERSLYYKDDQIKDHPNIKLVKKTLEKSFQLPIGYNGVTVGLEIKEGVDLVIPVGSKLSSL